MGTSKNSNGRIRSSAIIAVVGVIVGTTGCQPKKTTEMNSCSCACRQETESTVTIANKNFYSDAACGSFEGASCSVKGRRAPGLTTCPADGRVVKATAKRTFAYW